MEFEIEGPSEGHQRAQRWVRLLGGKQPSDRLRLDAGAARKLGLREVQLDPSGVERPYDRVDLIDALPGTLVRLPVLRVREAPNQVALGTGTGLSHAPSVAVTSVLRTASYDPNTTSLNVAAASACIPGRTC